ncbi:hypothetical protein B0T10DRAFT_557993 [Thelonectria olida]|uniref:Uncharacterized protein n=1 Tax=Thelonectria olida TaxID=1576542 RepID=A0A9P8WCZ3_9HYPO|nr:hypothetical protein B0T10DRAFT_557993 [Thelonectria olida]
MDSTGTPAPPHFGDNRGIKFHIKTGNAKYQCVLQDRASYERTKTTRQNSTDSVSSNASTSTAKSSH